jgi:uncharacterized integral membrane protein
MNLSAIESFTNGVGINAVAGMHNKAIFNIIITMLLLLLLLLCFTEYILVVPGIPPCIA